MKKFPNAFTILFALIVVVAALTWIIPAGQYERTMNETLGREAPVPGTKAGDIIQVMNVGFMIADRLLRPAQVGVSAGSPTPPPTSKE